MPNRIIFFELKNRIALPNFIVKSVKVKRRRPFKKNAIREKEDENIYDFRKFVYTIHSLLGVLINLLAKLSKQKDCFSL